MSYQVELTKRAYDDLDRLTAALAERWPEGADRLTARFLAASPRLESAPFSCGIASESRFVAQEVRRLLFDIRKGRTYRALFTVEGVACACSPSGPREKSP